MRLEHDAYSTPAWCVERLLEDVYLPNGIWLEPCAGDGSIIEAVDGAGLHPIWDAVEIRRECKGTLRTIKQIDRLYISDFLTWKPERKYAVALSNPPYSLAMEFLERCIPMAVYVVFLLRLNFLASAKRQAFFRSCPPDVYVLPNRPSFTGGGTDSTEYAWFVWGKERQRSVGRISVLGATETKKRYTQDHAV